MAVCRTILLIAAFFCVGAVHAQNRYAVYFKDKASTTYTIQDPGKYLSARAIARRIKWDIDITENDFPVNTSYVQQLTAAGAKVRYTSRWLNCAVVEATPAQALSLSLLPMVSKVDYAAPARSSSGRRRATKSTKETATIAAATRAQLQMVGIDVMQGENIRGEGVFVAILDAGFLGVNTVAPFEHLYSNNRIQYTRDVITNSSNVYRYDDHGTEVFSVIAANSSSFTGGAYEATFQLYVTEEGSGEYRIEEYNWLHAAEKADSSGVDVLASSLGYNEFDDSSMDYDKTTDLNGKTAIVSLAAKAALERGIVVVASAGNEGSIPWRTITPPADVDGVIAVGSITSGGARSSFSSMGPTSDGRIKPDVVALGSSTSVIKSSGSNGFTSGTSLAAPIVTSLIIGLIDRYPDINPRIIAQQVVATASRAATPDNLLGYGVPNYDAVKSAIEGLEPPEEITVYPNPVEIDTGKFYIRFKTPTGQATITIYDLMGRMLSSNVVNITAVNNPLEFNMAELPSAGYLLKVKTSSTFKTFKLVKP